MHENLFIPDIFSDSTPTFKKSDISIEKLLKNIITEHYPQISVNNICVEQFQGNEINSNNYKVTTASGVYLIKKFIDINEYTKLQKILSLNNYLTANNIKIGKIYSNNADKFITESDDNSFWSIFDFIEGHFFTGKSDSELISVAKEIGIFFEKLSKLPLEFYPIDKIEHLKNSRHLMDEMQNNKKNWSSFFGSELSHTLNDNWELLKKIDSKLIENQEIISNKQLTPSHIDLHPHNILVSKNKLKAILDIDSIKLDFNLIPIAFSMYKLLKQSIIAREIKNNSQEISRVSNIYFNALTSKFSISKEEIENLYIYAAAEIFRRIFIIFSLNLYHNDSRWNHVLSMHINGLKEAEIIFDSLKT